MALGLGNYVYWSSYNAGFTGLLDTYSGAAAAYSLRQLSSTYSGDAVRVRRSSDNTEQNIGFVSNELDTATLETFCSGTDGFVAIWYDQSGSANNAANATAANQPKIVASGSTILENGKPCVYYNGSRLDVNDNANLRNAQMSIFFAFNNNRSTRADFIACGNSATFELNNYIIGTNSLTQGSYFGRTPALQYLTGIADTQNLFSFLADNSSTSVDMYVNGGSILSLTNNTIGTDNTDGFYIGASYGEGGNVSGPVTGNIQEIIVYPTNESTNRTDIETNINSHYSIY